MTKLAKVVNLYGGPGSGKSTMAWHLSAELKYLGLNVEYVHEWVKLAAWEKRPEVFWKAQQHIYGNQSWLMECSANGADIIVTDCPLLMGLVYCRDSMGDAVHDHFTEVVYNDYAKYDNLNVFVNRVKPYNPKGRNQTEREAHEKDYEIISFLEVMGIDYTVANGERNGVMDVLVELEGRGWIQ